MSIKAAAIVLVCLVTPIPLVQASVYDSNVAQELHLTGGQKTAMDKLIRESRARRNHILRRHGIDPNAAFDGCII